MVKYTTAKRYSRDIRFDILKTIGILGIFAAHAIYGNTQSSLEIFLEEFRNFDVPLMVIISGLVFYRSSSGKEYSFTNYLKKRVPRLIIPVWVFLVIFFLLTYFITLNQDGNKAFPFTLKEIIGSFCLLNYISIGYVWIIRVFVLVAIVTPVLLKLRQKSSSKLFFGVYLAIVYGIYEVLASFILKLNIQNTSLSNPTLNFIYGRLFLFIFCQQICFYLIPYACLFGFGMTIATLKKREIIFICLLSGIVYLSLSARYYHDFGYFVSTYVAKFPPRTYYVVYGIFLSTLMYLLIDFIVKIGKKMNLPNSLINKAKTIIYFISSSSLWIYLWHILLIYYGKLILDIINIYPESLERFLIWFILAILITFIQKELVTYFIRKTQFGHKYSQALSVMFLQ